MKSPIEQGQLEKELRAFWRAVYVASVRAGRSPEFARLSADIAVQQFFDAEMPK